MNQICTLAILAWLFAALSMPVGAQGPVDDALQDGHAFFDEQVLPILRDHCYACHSHATEMSGNLLLDFASGWQQGGDRGPAVVPKDPDNSLLMQAVQGKLPDLMMPPEERLSGEQIQILRDWIARGAADPRTTPPLQEDLTSWWSLQPLAEPVLPSANETAIAPLHPIDAFLQARLDAAGLKAGPQADRRSLLRRVTVDLHGVLPTHDELVAFANDLSPDAYEKVVDRLLASPRYGERWARHWLDWTHFADSHGFEHDVMRMHAWRYRDYVIQSLNDDVPWPEWIRQQIAADVLYPDRPELIPGLGFLAAGPWDQSTAATAQTTFDYLDRDDMATLAMSVLTSSTVHCSRCHNHKFDPIPQSDYYAIQAVFAGIGRGNVPFDEDPKVARKRREARGWLEASQTRDRGLLLSARMDEEVAKWEQAHREHPTPWTPIAIDMVLANEGTQLVPSADGMITASGPRPATETCVIVGSAPIPKITAIRLDIFRDDALPMGGPGRNDNGNFHLSELVLEHFPAGVHQPTRMGISRAISDFDQEGWTIAHAIDGDPKTAWGIYPQTNQDHSAVFVLDQELSLQAGDRIAIQLRQLHGGFHTIGRFKICVTDAPTPQLSLLPMATAAAIQVAPNDRTEAQRLDLASYVARQVAEAWLQELPPSEFVYAAAPRFDSLPQSEFYKPWTAPKKVFVLKRGNVQAPADEAKPGGLTCLSHATDRFELLQPEDEGKRRSAFALWITHDENPLFWRSIVNRLWLHHFGQGIVDTPNDFGRMGSLPTHPELLDWLAIELRRSGGSLKHLHRCMVTSQAYRRSTESDEVSHGIDPENRFLWRATRKRLDAESFRDSLLQLAGTLDFTMRGPAVQWFRLGPAIQVTPSVDYTQYDWSGRDGNRRAIYRFVYRGQQDPFMEALDFPDAAQLTPMRTLTASPLQALALWNHDFVLHACSRIEAQLQRDWGDDVVGGAYASLFLRPPDPEERRTAQAYMERTSLASLLRVMLNSSEFLFGD